MDINIKKTIISAEHMFNSPFIISASFLPGFDSSKIAKMEDMFRGTSLVSLDMKYLNFPSLTNLLFFIKKSSRFERFKNLKEYIIDISSFDTSKITICVGMFQDIDSDVIIKISNKFKKCREEIPFYNKVINIDEIECQKKYDFVKYVMALKKH